MHQRGVPVRNRVFAGEMRPAAMTRTVPLLYGCVATRRKRMRVRGANEYDGVRLKGGDDRGRKEDVTHRRVGDPAIRPRQPVPPIHTHHLTRPGGVIPGPGLGHMGRSQVHITDHMQIKPIHASISRLSNTTPALSASTTTPGQDEMLLSQMTGNECAIIQI
jgi:hypothetical protein